MRRLQQQQPPAHCCSRCNLSHCTWEGRAGGAGGGGEEGLGPPCRKGACVAVSAPLSHACRAARCSAVRRPAPQRLAGRPLPVTLRALAVITVLIAPPYISTAEVPHNWK